VGGVCNSNRSELERAGTQTVKEQVNKAHSTTPAESVNQVRNLLWTIFKSASILSGDSDKAICSNTFLWEGRPLLDTYGWCCRSIPMMTSGCFPQSQDKIVMIQSRSQELPSISRNPPPLLTLAPVLKTFRQAPWQQTSKMWDNSWPFPTVM